jgi:hypothetical protein
MDVPRVNTHVQFGEVVEQICLLVRDPGAGDRESAGSIWALACEPITNSGDDNRFRCHGPAVI